MIDKVVLDNWKTHKHSEFEFNKGTNVILGIMGSGKTSLINGISYALFGTFPALKKRQVKLEDIITSKPYKADSTQVQVDFTINETQYTVKRKIDKNGKTKSAEIRTKDGNLLEGPAPNKVTEVVERTLGMTYDLFSRAVYSEQNEVDYFLKIPKGQRKTKIDELLNIDKYETARRSSQFIINRLKDKTKEQEKWLNENTGTTNENEANELKQEIETLKQKADKYQDRLQRIESELTR
ncbi:MAG: SMC family ATPase, partial [Candidatus Diapherotrites archaeon]|nr:SMC family ATPase [Candidatus Diapherotrites archaeon]